MSVLFANAVDVLLKYLRPARPDMTFGTTVPVTRDATSPTGLVVLRRIGGTADRVTDRPRVDLLVWHSTEFKAQQLAQQLRSLLLFDLPGQIVDGHVVYDVTEFSGPTAFPDPAGSSQPIVLFTVEIGIRGANT